MGIVFAILFLAIAIAAVGAYVGTPHVTTVSSCSSINAFGHHLTVAADCRYISIGEIAIGVLFFLFAVVAALSARPRL